MRKDNAVSKTRSHIVCWSVHTEGEDRNRFENSDDDNDNEGEDKIITFDSIFFIITRFLLEEREKRLYGSAFVRTHF